MESWELNSGNQNWLQVPLTTEQSHWTNIGMFYGSSNTFIVEVLSQSVIITLLAFQTLFQLGMFPSCQRFLLVKTLMVLPVHHNVPTHYKHCSLTWPDSVSFWLVWHHGVCCWHSDSINHSLYFPTQALPDLTTQKTFRDCW